MSVVLWKRKPTEPDYMEDFAGEYADKTQMDAEKIKKQLEKITPAKIRRDIVQMFWDGVIHDHCRKYPIISIEEHDQCSDEEINSIADIVTDYIEDLKKKANTPKYIELYFDYSDNDVCVILASKLSYR